MSIRLSTAARAVQVQAVATLLAGGTLEVYDEPRYPENPSAPVVDAAKCLLRMAMPDACAVDGDSMVFKGITESRILAQGSPKRFRMLSKDGVVVLDGTCGNDGEDMVLKRDDGGTLFYTGMRVQLDEFRHTLSFEGA